MDTYILAVLAVVVVSSAALLFILKKNNMFSIGILIAIIISSASVSLLFPIIFRTLTGQKFFGDANSGVALALLVTLVIYITLAFFLSVIISIAAPNIKIERFFGKLKKPFKPVKVELPGLVENYLEKSVDSRQNTDKMGLGEMYDTKEELGSSDSHMELSINDCIDEAFRLKERKDLEGAILYYMYALDKKPEKDLVFWIILDICVLYKSLGQTELAKEILESYVNAYGDAMDVALKAEIERNLVYS